MTLINFFVVRCHGYCSREKQYAVLRQISWKVWNQSWFFMSTKKSLEPCTDWEWESFLPSIKDPGCLQFKWPLKQLILWYAAHSMSNGNKSHHVTQVNYCRFKVLLQQVEVVLQWVNLASAPWLYSCCQHPNGFTICLVPVGIPNSGWVYLYIWWNNTSGWNSSPFLSFHTVYYLNTQSKRIASLC